jgi:PTH1 family peptidyl-tRNA hydrolase
VLRKPPLDDRLAIDKCVADSLAALPQLLAGDFKAATMKIHAGPQRPKPPRRAEPADATAATPPTSAAQEPSP